MKTVHEIVIESKAKFGDRFTNGQHTWTVRPYARPSNRKYFIGNPVPDEHGSFYLRDVNGNTLEVGLTVPGLTAAIAIIPGFRKEPEKITVYKYLVKHASEENPSVTEGYYPSDEAAKSACNVSPLTDIEWVHRIDKCSKVIEVDCPC